MAEDLQNTHTGSQSERTRRVRQITRNFFLHIHATRVHLHSLKPTYTFGLGIILGMLFIIMVLTCRDFGC